MRTPGKLSKYRAARDRAIYRRLPAPAEPAPTLYAGPYTYVEFHHLWRALIAPIPKTDLGLEITLHIHTTLREWLDRIEITEDDTINEAHEQEVRQALAVLRAIKNGSVLPFTINVNRRRNSIVPAPPRWVPGPYERDDSDS